MKSWMTHVAVAAALLAALDGAALAQAAAPVAAPAPVAATAPAVESVDILKQNQAERTRDQPGNAAPTFRIVKEGVKNYSSLPALEAGVLVQPKQQFPGQGRATTAGEAWREYRNGPLTKIGGWLLLIAFGGIAAVYFLLGKVKLKGARSGRLIERFTSIERLAHWATALSFVALSASGLTILFGKYVLMHVFGHTLFGWLAYLCKNVHNFAGPVFTVSIVVTFIVFIKDNFPAPSDWQWLIRLGGMYGGGKHASAGRFNAGEKIWFWTGVVVLGLIISGSGFVLDKLVPGIDYPRGLMQIANVIHLTTAVVMSAMALAHIYIGTIGMEGALEAMTTGYVDDTWAEEHHDLWYADVQSGKVPRVRTEEGAAYVAAHPRNAI
ncbi:formate dehydrogenase subunit gamma [Actimicrobium sp. GrIS 1.19]|uniref:formate dehydrogenase subunit gamma n=1 Tax=Actimicrobium sp. GrIS 1.19 TaxID=3071708 RepID=UPI002DF7E4BD|nr:formate dehydrogenase subunit gamma [Actimicrobium sp. GrIS 1.19]